MVPARQSAWSAGRYCGAMRRGLLLLTLCLVAVACGGGGAPASAPTASSEAAAGDLPQNLAFTADLVGGGQLEGGDLAGRDVVLWFWAPW